MAHKAGFATTRGHSLSEHTGGCWDKVCVALSKMLCYWEGSPSSIYGLSHDVYEMQNRVMPEISYIYHDNFVIHDSTYHRPKQIWCWLCSRKEKHKIFSFMCTCVCVCAHAHICVCLYAGQHMCAYMWYQRPISGCHFPLLSTCFCYYCCLLACFWGRASHFCLELNDLSSLPVQWVPGIHLFLLLQGHNYELCYHIHLLLFGLLGSSSGLHAWTESTFYPLSYLPSPHGRGLSRLILGKKKILLGKKRSLWIKCHPMDSQQIHLSWQAVRKK